jgi:hypothetical protein
MVAVGIQKLEVYEEPRRFEFIYSSVSLSREQHDLLAQRK